MRRLLWKLPGDAGRWDLADRAALYPALYLRGDFDVSLADRLDDEALARADLLVVVADGDLGEDDLAALRAVPGGSFILPRGGLSAGAAQAARHLGAAILAPRDEGPLASAFPPVAGLRVLAVPGCAARVAEDQLLAQNPPNPASTPPGGIVLVADDEADFAIVAPALRRAQARFGLPATVFARSPWSPDLPGVRVAPREALSLATLSEAAIFACALVAEPPTSDRPAIWVRSALLAGTPVVAASHPSLDGLADLCVLDDWDRGFALYQRDEARRLAMQIRGQAQMAAALSPTRIGGAWREAIMQASGPSPSRDKPTLIALFDLAQDLDVILPVVEALHARGAAQVRAVVSDWLLTESPRTLARLEAAGLDVEVIDRGAALRGETPHLAGAGGLLVASDANVEPHRVGRRLVERARAKGLATVSLQHGLENIGLTYRDAHHGEAIDFGAEQVVTWGPAESLPAWVRPETRRGVVALGDPKAPVAAAEDVPWPQGPWRRRVCVFENLHWDRYDAAWRARFLADIQAVADAAPDSLFLIKPHHAGRWLTRNPARAPKGRNLVVIDPRDPQWEPFTAPALIAGADRVLTTPSTVALDAARAGRPVALFGYGLDLSAYWPLPVIEQAVDIDAFLGLDEDAHIAARERFLARVLLPGSAAHRIAAQLERQLIAHRRAISARAAAAHIPAATESVR